MSTYSLERVRGNLKSSIRGSLISKAPTSRLYMKWKTSILLKTNSILRVEKRPQSQSWKGPFTWIAFEIKYKRRLRERSKNRRSKNKRKRKGRGS
jgi:hypothetical protein